MGFGAEMEMKMYMKGEDEGDDDMLDNEHSPGGIVIESIWCTIISTFFWILVNIWHNSW